MKTEKGGITIPNSHYDEKIEAAKLKIWEASAKEKEVVLQLLEFQLQGLISAYAKVAMESGLSSSVQSTESNYIELLQATTRFLEALAEKEKAMALTLAQLKSDDHDPSFYRPPNPEQPFWQAKK